MFWPTVLSPLGFLAAISTIDIGGYGNFHVVGAVYYFIVAFLMNINFTIIAIKMRNWDVTFMSWGSLCKKMFVAGYLGLIWIYCLVGILTEQNDNDKYIVIA